MGNKKTCAAKRFFDALSPAVKAAFICCVIAGFAAHIFAFTNIIPNSDGISRVADPQQMTVSGRWFLHYATAWNGFVQMPAVIGAFSVLFAAISSALTCSLLKIENAVIGGAVGIAMIIFPSVAYTYLYMFTASAYFFGILLAVLAVWLCARFRFGFLFAAIPLACAIGTYQAYLAVAASLSLICVIMRALDGEKSVKEILLDALKHIAFLALGAVLYYLTLKLFLWAKDLELLSYKGMDTLLGSLTPAGIISLIGKAYKQFFGYFLIRGYASYNGALMTVSHWLFFVCGAAGFIVVTVKRKLYRRPGAFALTLVLCLLLPLALDLGAVMGEATAVMRYSLVFTYVLVLALAQRAASDTKEKTDKKDKKQGVCPVRAGALALCAVVFILSFQIDNLAYTASATAHRATESFAARLGERVESTPGYRNGMQVAVIGGFPSDVYYNDLEAFAAVEDYSCLSSSVIPLNKHVYYYLNDWIGVRWEEPDEETMIAVSASDEFKEMPLYPSDGSVKVSGDRVIVKLAAQYTPKQDYEIQYENRK